MATSSKMLTETQCERRPVSSAAAMQVARLVHEDAAGCGPLPCNEHAGQTVISSLAKCTDPGAELSSSQSPNACQVSLGRTAVPARDSVPDESVPAECNCSTASSTSTSFQTTMGDLPPCSTGYCCRSSASLHSYFSTAADRCTTVRSHKAHKLQGAGHHVAGCRCRHQLADFK